MAGMFKAINDGSDIIAQADGLTKIEQRRVVRSALRDIMKPLLATAKQLAPKDTGSLAASLKLNAIPRSRRGIGVMVATSGTLNKSHVAKKLNPFIGMHFYGSFVEFGHHFGKRGSNIDIGWEFRKRAKKTQLAGKREKLKQFNKARPKFPGIPFLKWAGEQHIPTMDSDFRRQFAEGVREILGGVH